MILVTKSKISLNGVYANNPLIIVIKIKTAPAINEGCKDSATLGGTLDGSLITKCFLFKKT